MAHFHHPQEPTFPFDDLYCLEDPLDQPQEQEQEHYGTCNNNSPLLLDPDIMFWDNQELTSLLSKESTNPLILRTDPSNLQSTRQEAVDWILKSRAHYGFSPLTAVLAVDYLERFIVTVHVQRDEPWTTQLTAVACLSLAAKVEETHVPPLLDLQEEESEFYFGAKAIQTMELLVLSALKWKMNPATVVSFIDYFARRLELEGHLCCEFLSMCEPLVLSVISDLRYTHYSVSVMATAITLHVMHRLRPSLVEDYQIQLFSILDIQKHNVEVCRKLVMERTAAGGGYGSKKRKFGSRSGFIPGSPNGVLDICFSPESESYTWAVRESESKKMRPFDY